MLPIMAVLAGIGVAAGIATAPGDLLDAVVTRSGVSVAIPQAGPPVGVTGRSLIALAIGGFVAALGLVGRLRLPTRTAHRRADAHPDAPPCRPLRASGELGEALPIEPDPPVPPAVQDMPADLDQPLSAFDPDAIPARPKEPVRAVPPMTRMATIVALPPEDEVRPDRITAFSLAPVTCAPHAEPATIARVDTRHEPIGDLVARLERVARDAARSRRDRQPSLDDTLARLRQMATG
ncbi:hypothetical protein ASG29_04755 [Sphingomonas sp. Leaf412]|nr:hypothetical protein ASG29_04755 [Sphingomonas sp. Leaf412]